VAQIVLAVVFMLGAGSFGAVLNRVFAISRLESAVVAIGLVCVLGLLQVLLARVRDRGQFGDRVAELSRGAADLARQVAEIGRRMATAEIDLARAAERTRAALEPTATEIDLLRRSLKELAQSVAAHERALHKLSAAPADIGAPAALSLALDAMAAPVRAPTAQLALTEIPAAPNGGAPAAPNGGGQNGFSAIERAAEAGRFELYLQPVVTLPQRKVRFYEAMARLRSDDGELLNPCDYARQSEDTELMSMVDDVLLFRSVQVARRLLAQERDIGVFCHVAGHSLLDPAFLAQVADFIEANRALASCLVFEFSQKRVRAMSGRERECLGELAALGFRFSMDRVGDLVLDPRELAERGFRFVKVPAALLLNRAEAKASGIVASEFSDRLGRFGIDLIAEAIDTETQVVDLLDFDVRFGQGALFSPPKPVRPDIVRSSPEQPLACASGRIRPALSNAVPESAPVAANGGASRVPEPVAAAEAQGAPAGLSA
jgi:cyclic-di-GMP phosphodiesterase, flagellum assembly factor TipF